MRESNSKICQSDNESMNIIGFKGNKNFKFKFKWEDIFYNYAFNGVLRKRDEDKRTLDKFIKRYNLDFKKFVEKLLLDN